METVRSTIWGSVGSIAMRYGDRDALVHVERGLRFNYALLSWEVERAAKGLIHMGIKAGDRVAIWAPNVPEWLVAMLALCRMGAILVPVDPGAGREDVRFVLGQSECRGVIVSKALEDEECVNTVLYARDVIPSLEHVVVIADETFPETVPWAELTAMGEDEDGLTLTATEQKVVPQDPVAIMYTSGTTGRPKGVVLDHSGLINKSMASTERQGIGHEDRMCLFFPLFHMFGNTCIALAGLLRGAALIIPSDQFDPRKTLDAIHKERCTAIYASPSMLIALVDHPDFRKKRWSTVKKGTIGGAPCPMELMKRVVQEIGVSHLTVAYGITEASSWITMTRPDDPMELRVGTIGTALPCNEVKIVDPVTGDDRPPGVQGELCTRGFLMKEYYRMPGATASAIDREGWFHTGDLGEVDGKGYFRITGRLKDVIVREGVEIHPSEVEECLYGHPDVSEVQVFGFPHGEKGQEVAAWFKVKPGAQTSEIALAAYAKDHLEERLLPHYFKIVSEFPTTKSGKVQKYRLAEMAVSEYLSGEAAPPTRDPALGREVIYSDKAPGAVGPYSQAIRAGRFIFTSGQVGIDPTTGKLVGGGMEAETRQAMENLRSVLKAAGADFSGVVKATVFLTDLRNFALFNRVYGAFFGSNPPARSAVQVAALPLGASVEIEMVAVVD